ncbi:MAG: hypothetical protein ACTHZ9_10660 [Leucobacter sp.]
MSASQSPVITIDELERYDGPELFLFIGISTAGSSVHYVFPSWAPLVRPGSVLRGVDLPEDAPAEEFQRLVIAMRDNPRVCGAVVTSHKLRLYRYISELLDAADPLVGITHEINSLDTRDGRIAAYARDAQSLDIVLDTTGTEEPRPERSMVCIGAGGSAIALMLAMGLDIPATIAGGAPQRPPAGRRRGHLTILGRREAALSEIADVRDRAAIDPDQVQLVLAPSPEAVAAVVTDCTPGTVVANATGLGKFEPGSPLPGPDAFPADVLAWDFNYRGPLTFLEQGREAGAATEDGWDYFLAGWAAGLTAVSGVELTPELFERFREVSGEFRP